jgi:ABC-type nitrate/sulfonate/bicarbonate transport system substrate-binding protein
MAGCGGGAAPAAPEAAAPSSAEIERERDRLGYPRPDQTPVTATSAPPAATVKVVVLGTASDAGMYVADGKGFFRQQGTDGRVQGDPDPTCIVDGQHAEYAVQQLGTY